MENFWNVLFQLMKHGTNTLHVTFIFLLRVHRDDTHCIPNGTQHCIVNRVPFGMHSLCLFKLHILRKKLRSCHSLRSLSEKAYTLYTMTHLYRHRLLKAEATVSHLGVCEGGTKSNLKTTFIILLTLFASASFFFLSPLHSVLIREGYAGSLRELEAKVAENRPVCVCLHYVRSEVMGKCDRRASDRMS